MSLVGPNGRPLRPRARAIPDDVLATVLQNHEERLNAVGAQQIHLGIMVEYLTDKLGEAMPDFQIDEEEFVKFRDHRWNEMQEEAKAVAKARTVAMQAAEEAANAPTDAPPAFDLDDLDFDLNDFDEEPG